MAAKRCAETGRCGMYVLGGNREITRRKYIIFIFKIHCLSAQPDSQMNPQTNQARMLIRNELIVEKIFHVAKQK